MALMRKPGFSDETNSKLRLDIHEVRPQSAQYQQWEVSSGIYFAKFGCHRNLGFTPVDFEFCWRYLPSLLNWNSSSLYPGFRWKVGLMRSVKHLSMNRVSIQNSTPLPGQEGFEPERWNRSALKDTQHMIGDAPNRQPADDSIKEIPNVHDL